MDAPALLPDKALKNPWVLAIGVLLGLVLIIAVMRKGTAATGSTSDVTLQSQALASSADVQLGAQSTQYNIAALGYQSTLAGLAVENHTTDVNAQTAIELQSLSTLTNTANNAAQLSMAQTLQAGAITINGQNNKAMFDISQLNANTAITLAPTAAALSRDLATIQGSQAVALANTNASAAVTLAQINASNRIGLAQATGNAQTTHDLITGAPSLIDSALKLFGAGGSAGSAISGPSVLDALGAAL